MRNKISYEELVVLEYRYENKLLQLVENFNFRNPYLKTKYIVKCGIDDGYRCLSPATNKLMLSSAMRKFNKMIKELPNVKFTKVY